MELGSNEAIKHAVAAGVGAGLLGTRVVADEVRAGRLAVAHPAGGRLAIAFAFVYHGDRAHGPALRAFLRLARARRPRR
jgi:DNA-binding transcriptional LysR family regulator